MENTIRLNKFLANAGLTARRKVSDILEQNQILVNGKRVTEPGIRINPTTDKVTFNGQPIKAESQLVYFLLNKPKDVISTVQDEHERKTVVQLINAKERIYPVGRLDADTKGALLLTNDGALTQKLTHPSSHIDKTYLCLIAGSVTDYQLSKLQSGIKLKDGITAPAQARILEIKPKRTLLELTIHEGKNHQVKRMLSALKLELLELKRISIGPIQLADLPLGKYRELTPEEVTKLKS